MEFVEKLLLVLLKQQQADQRDADRLAQKVEATYSRVEAIHERMGERLEIIKHLKQRLENYEREQLEQCTVISTSTADRRVG
jgi:hypothetical protein